MRLTRKEQNALIATGNISVVVDAKQLTPEEATKLVKRFEIFSQLPDVINSLIVLNKKE